MFASAVTLYLNSMHSLKLQTSPIVIVFFFFTFCCPKTIIWNWASGEWGLFSSTFNSKLNVKLMFYKKEKSFFLFLWFCQNQDFNQVLWWWLVLHSYKEDKSKMWQCKQICVPTTSGIQVHGHTNLLLWPWASLWKAHYFLFWGSVTLKRKTSS